MKRLDPYPDGAAVEAAIKQAAAVAHQRNGSRSVPALIRQAYYDRFLCRVFADERGIDLLLKGGTGVLARIADARTTRDVDLQRCGGDLDDALDELRLLARTDLGDHFRFVQASSQRLRTGGAQPYLRGVTVTFEVLIGVKRVTALTVDLVAAPHPTGGVRPATPANRLLLPRLVVCDYRLYPVEDQIADKVCAVMGQYASGASSREKDLVDLVVLALTTPDLDLATLRRALGSEFARRGMSPPAGFAIPSRWGPAYRRMAAAVPRCRDHRDVGEAARPSHRWWIPHSAVTATGPGYPRIRRGPTDRPGTLHNAHYPSCDNSCHANDRCGRAGRRCR